MEINKPFLSKQTNTILSFHASHKSLDDTTPDGGAVSDMPCTMATVGEACDTIKLVLFI